MTAPPLLTVGDAVELWSLPDARGRVRILDEGDVQAVDIDAGRVCVRWRGPGGLRAVRWMEMGSEQLRRRRGPWRP